jgi:hypothetical protein
MPALPDLQKTLFTDQTAGNGSFTYCTAVQVRGWNADTGVDSLEADRVCLGGNIDSLGSATLVTFVVEQGPTASGPWSPIGMFDTPAFASGVATAALGAVNFTRAATGAIPSLSFEPDQAYFRVGVKGNAANAVVDMTAYLSQRG